MDTIGVLTAIALVLWIVLAVCLLVGIALAVPTMRRLRDLLARLEHTLARAEGRLEPALQHLERSADNLDYITTSVRADVEALGDTVERAARSAHRVAELAEDRATEINGFLEVVQQEAEETFYSSAALLRALRGVRDRGDREGRRSA